MRPAMAEESRCLGPQKCCGGSSSKWTANRHHSPDELCFWQVEFCFLSRSRHEARVVGDVETLGEKCRGCGINDG